MKYIKPFELNENNHFSFTERRIKDQCETRLVYLTDEDFQVDYKVTDDIIQRRDFIIDIRLTKPDTYLVRNGIRYFSWNDVKDTIIPLVQQLNKQYRVEIEIFDGNYDDKRHHTVDWVINDGPSRWFAPKTIRWIKIALKRYLFKE